MGVKSGDTFGFRTPMVGCGSNLGGTIFFFLLQSPFVEGDEQLVRGARIGVVIKLATGSLPYGLSDRKASAHGNRIRLCYPSKVTRPF